jgi:VanZ family protein
MKPAGEQAQGRSLDEVQSLQLAGMVLDIPPRVRLVLGIAAIVGVGLIVMQSLVGHQPGTIRVDKIIHFSGYAVLAAVFVLSLRPALFLPVLAALLGIGFAIEYLQPLTGRERDFRDAMANTLGVAIGAGAGLLVRGLYAWLRRDLAFSALNRKRVRCRAGDVLVRQGDPVRVLHVIKSGEARLTRTVEWKEASLAVLGPGDVIGLLGLVQGTPQYTTVTAQTPMTLYRLTLDELIETSGGRMQPAAVVLQAAARLLRKAADRMVGAGVDLEVSEGKPQGIPPSSR